MKDLSKIYKIPFSILNNSIKKNKLSHAYLFSGDKKIDKLELAKYFAKMIFCDEDKPCDNCYCCNQIENNSFSDLLIVDPKEMVIKKDDILRIQDDFSKKSLEGGNRIYIINGAERMNKQASNSLLKFLEEPEEGIIGIIISDNSHELLDTIVSRCQKIIFGNNQKIKQTQDERLSMVISLEFEDKVKTLFEFIEAIELDNMDAFLFEKRLILDKFKTKEDLNDFLNVLSMFYVDVLNYYYNIELDVFLDEKERIEKIMKNNNIDDIINKVKILIDICALIKYNVNTNLLIDKLIFSFKEVKNG